MEKYKIVFCGELQDGHDLLSVKARLAALFKIPGVVVDKLFQGKPVLVRTGLQLDTAQSYKKEFERTGALCQMLEVSKPPQPPAPIVSEAPAIEAAVATPPLETRASFPSSPSPASASRQFTYRPANRVEKKNNTRVMVVTVVILAIAVIFFISLLNKNRTGYQSATPDQMVTTPQSNHPATRSASPPPQKSQPAAKRGLLSENTIPFQDPKNHYIVYLPEGCKALDKSSGERSKIAYSYSFNTSVIIIATPMKKKWDAQAAMNEKVTAIQGGKAGDLSRFTIERFGLVNFNELDGYEIVLSGNNQLAHAYALVSPNNVAFAISIVTMGGYRQENHDILDSAIRASFSYQ